MSRHNHHWTSGNALPWALGVTLGLILGIIMLIVIPRTLGNSAASKPEASAPATTTPEPAPSSTEAAAAGPANAEDGKTFFASNCAGCHGANAEGGMGPKLDKAAAWNMEQFGAAVHEGKAPDKTLAAAMPHFTDAQVSAAQLADVHAFLQKTFDVKSEAAPAATEATPPATEAAAPAGDAAAGKAKFAGTCAGCHGANAEGGMGPALKIANEWTIDQFTAAVREGKAPDKTLSSVMPHFTTEMLSDTDLANIDAYVRTLH